MPAEHRERFCLFEQADTCGNRACQFHGEFDELWEHLSRAIVHASGELKKCGLLLRGIAGWHWPLTQVDRVDRRNVGLGHLRRFHLLGSLSVSADPRD